MFCNKCGAENPDDSAFCKKCGVPLETEVETRVAARETGEREDETGKKLFSITPTTKFVIAGYAAAVVAAFLLVAVVSLFVPAVSPLVAAMLGLLLLLIPVFFHIKQKLVRYTLTDTTIEIDRGLIARTTQNVPLRRIQDVTVTATLLQRLLGYGDITIGNASEDGGKVILDNVDAPKRYADQILKQMRLLDR